MNDVKIRYWKNRMIDKLRSAYAYHDPIAKQIREMARYTPLDVKSLLVTLDAIDADFKLLMLQIAEAKREGTTKEIKPVVAGKKETKSL